MPGGTKSAPGPLTQAITAILRARMGRDNITKTALAAAIGVSRPQVQKILAGQKQIDVEQLDEMCWVLGLNAREVIAEADAVSSGRHVGWTSPD